MSLVPLVVELWVHSRVTAATSGVVRYRPEADSKGAPDRRIRAMTNRFKWATGLASILFAIAAASAVTGIPFHRSKGVVVGNYCESTQAD